MSVTNYKESLMINTKTPGNLLDINSMASEIQEYLKTFVKSEDTQQEVMLEVCRKIDKFEGRCSFKTWLHLVAKGVQIKSFRKRGSEVELSYDPIDPHENEDPRMESLNEALEKLSEEERKIALSIGESARLTAESLGISVPALYQKRWRVKQKIKQYLEVDENGFLRS